MRLPSILLGAALALTGMSSATAEDPERSQPESASEAVTPPAEDDGPVGSKPASVGEILEGVGSCFRNVKAHGEVDVAGLKADQWKSGGSKDIPAKFPLPEMKQLALGKGNVILIIQHTGISATCQILAQVTFTEDRSAVREGIIKNHGLVPFDDYDGDKYFKSYMKGRFKKGETENTLLGRLYRATIAPIDKDGKKYVAIMVLPKADPS